jgi:hypothetical protein
VFRRVRGLVWERFGSINNIEDLLVTENRAYLGLPGAIILLVQALDLGDRLVDVFGRHGRMWIKDDGKVLVVGFES